MRLIPFLRNSKVVFAEVSAKRIKIFVFAKNRSRLLKYVETPFGDKASAAAELEKLSKKLRLKYASLYIGVSQSIAINKYVDLPSTDDKEIPGILRWQLPNLVFYPAEDILYSYKIIKKTAVKSEIMLFLVSKKLLMPYLQAFSKAGFNIEKIVLSPEIIARWAMEKAGHYGIKFPVCLINLDSRIGELSVIDKNGLLFARGFNVSDNEPADQIAREIEISLDVYKKMPIASSISQFFLIGDERVCNSVLPNIKTFLLSKASFMRIRGISGFESVGPLPVSFAVAKQFASIDKLEFDMVFNPYEFLKKQEKRNVMRDLLYTVVLSGLLVMIFFYHLVSQYAEQKKLMQAFKEKDKKLSSVSEKIKEMQGLIQELNDALPEERFLYVLKDISSAKDDSITIELLVYKQGFSVSVKGFTDDLSNLFSFVEKLSHSRRFENCEIKYAVKKEVKGIERISFELLCKLKGGRDGKT